MAELRLWNKDVGINIEKKMALGTNRLPGNEGDTPYGAARDGYVLSDRGTWIHFKNKGGLQILVEGDKRLFNQYAAMLVNPDKHPNVKNVLGQAFIDWLVSPDGQKAIADYKIKASNYFFRTLTIRTDELAA